VRYEMPMPSLGADMDHGKLMKWKILPGDEVKKNQAIAVVETTKSTVEIESFRDGKVLELIAKEGDEINVGESIASFDVTDSEELLSALSRTKISPAAKKLAENLAIDLSKIKGTGDAGVVTLRDIQAFSQAGADLGGAPEHPRPREAISKAMSRSKKEIPHYYLKSRLNLHHLMQWLDEINSKRSPQERILIPVALLRSVVLALKIHKEFNGHYLNEKFERKSPINLGVAVNLKSGGVLVPALLEADDKNLHQLNISFQDLILRARKGELKNRELTEGTITISNLGDLGSDEVFGIIFPPQVALICFGRIREEAVVLDGLVRSSLVVDVTLSADHRATDGMEGARLLSTIGKILTTPNLMENTDEQFRHEDPP
jgi:pyruvate dehydrogenase E2 component (dihydrolipoamide acetyltransferase)